MVTYYFYCFFRNNAWWRPFRESFKKIYRELILLRNHLNVTMDLDLDCSGGHPALKDSVKCVDDILMNCDLVGIWRIRNPDRKKFTLRQKKHNYPETP